MHTHTGNKSKHLEKCLFSPCTIQYNTTQSNMPETRLIFKGRRSDLHMTLLTLTFCGHKSVDHAATI